jgi:superfamily I DNA/RNA helicase
VYADEARTDIPARQREILDAFCTLINDLRFRAEREPASRLLDELVAAIGYDDYLESTCDKKQAEARSRSVRDFIGWLSKKGEADRKNLLELTQMIALITMLEGRSKRNRTRCVFRRCTPRKGSNSRTFRRRARGRRVAASRVHRERQRRGGAAALSTSASRAPSGACTCRSAASAAGR